MRESDNDKCIKNLVSVFVSTTSYSLFSVATEQVIIRVLKNSSSYKYDRHKEMPSYNVAVVRLKPIWFTLIFISFSQLIV